VRTSCACRAMRPGGIRGHSRRDLP
jgi:hypothetical protein